MYVKILLFSLIILNYASAICEVNAPRLLIKIKTLNKSIFDFQNCSNEEEQQIFNFLNDSTGTVSSNQISEVLNFQVNIKNNFISIKNLQNVIADQFDLNFKANISGLSNQQNLDFITSNELDFRLECNIAHCKAEDNILKIYTAENSYVVSFSIQQKDYVYVPVKDINAFGAELKANLFEKKLVPIKKNGNYLTHLNEIHFYKPNKKITQNQPVDFSDLTPIKLANPGQKIKVILHSKDITLKSTAVARQSGHLNETIEVYSPDTNKKFLGKLVDFNTVRVEL